MRANEERQELIAQIERVRPLVIDGLFEEMYQNPFWEARYGEKGMKHTRLDTNYHINQLVSAISLDLPSLSVQYYHWLQGLLVYRGMCTLHIYETIDCIARLFARLIPNAWPDIEPYLRTGEQGLAYDHPACSALTSAEIAVAQSTTNRMFDPSIIGRTAGEREIAACLRDNRYHLSYLIDAVGNNLDQSFEKYIAFLTGFLPKYGVSLESLFQDLRILSVEIGTALPTEYAAPFIALLDQTLRKYAHPAL